MFEQLVFAKMKPREGLAVFKRLKIPGLSERITTVMIVICIRFKLKHPTNTIEFCMWGKQQ